MIIFIRILFKVKSCHYYHVLRLQSPFCCDMYYVYMSSYDWFTKKLILIKFEKYDFPFQLTMTHDSNTIFFTINNIQLSHNLPQRNFTRHLSY